MAQAKAQDPTLARFDRTQKRAGEEANTASDLIDKAKADEIQQTGEDRSLISKTVIFTYAAIVTLAFFYIVFTAPACPEGQVCGNVEAWKTQMEMLRDMIVTVVLPIVTLMLGFYFGTETSKTPKGGKG